MQKIRFIKQFVLKSLYTYEDAEGNLITKEAHHHIRFGLIHQIKNSYSVSENLIDIEFPDSGPIKGIARIDKSFIEFVAGPYSRTHSPSSRGCCKK